VRAFAENALLQIPTLSLDAIRFRRVGTGSGTIEAEVRFTLYGVMTDGVKR
jgi:hypothetical protein